MNARRNDTNTLVNIDIVSIVMLVVSLLLLSLVALEGSLTPILLYALMIAMAMVLIILFSNKEEIFFKTKLFVFFFSLYSIYTLINSYIILSTTNNVFPYDYIDEITFYHYSNFGLSYITGEENFLEMFTNWRVPFSDVSLRVFFSSLIAYFSILIDGENNMIVQKLLSPFLGGLLLVVLYSTLKHQFLDRAFALNATLAYGLLSAVFTYSIPLLRDIDIALAYMIFFFLFLQKNSFINLVLLFLVAYTTTYLRTESGLVLYGLILLYSYFYIRELRSRSIKFIFFIFLMLFFIVILFLQFPKIIGMIEGRNAVNLERSIAQASTSSIGVLLNKFPFPLSTLLKTLFGQIQPFPFFNAIDNPQRAISGIFWPFIVIMMFYAVLKKNIRILLDDKVKYLLMVAIAILFLMSSEPQARRMMSVYPVMYIVSLYAFTIIPKNDIKGFFSYYLFGIFSLNVFYYLIKL